MAVRYSINKVLYFIEFTGTQKGTKIEKAVKEMCQTRFHHMMCTGRGMFFIYAQIVEYANLVKQKECPRGILPGIKFNPVYGTISFEAKNATDNFCLLNFTRITACELGPDEESFLIDKQEA